MVHGRQDDTSLARGGTELRAVFFDLKRTLILTDPPLAVLLAQTYERVAGIHVNPALVLRVTEAAHRAAHRDQGNPHTRWARTNRRILATLAGVPVRRVPFAVAEAVRSHLRSLEERYAILPSSRRWLLERLVRHVPLGIASTESGEYAQRVLDRFGARNFFRADWIFTSDSIGEKECCVYKPTARFWELVRAKTGVANPRAIALVGDHPATDAPAIQFGHPVVLIDECCHHRPFVTNSPLLAFCNSVYQAHQALKRFGLPRS